MGRQKTAKPVPAPQAPKPVLVEAVNAQVLIRVWRKPDGSVVREFVNDKNQIIGFGVIKEAAKPPAAPPKLAVAETPKA